MTHKTACRLIGWGFIAALFLLAYRLGEVL
jgi:hypothetical protein